MENTKHITSEDVARIVGTGGIAYPHPRKGTISINGGRERPATPAAIVAAIKAKATGQQ